MPLAPNPLEPIAVLAPAEAGVDQRRLATLGDVRFLELTPTAQARAAIRQVRPGWLIVAIPDDDRPILRALLAIRDAAPTARLAVLGPRNDPTRFERWLRLGAMVYLPRDAPGERLKSSLAAASTLDVVIVDAGFVSVFSARQPWLTGPDHLM